jgi:hypothetical protein
MKKKKYSLGTGSSGVVNDYMKTPSEVLSENSINVGKALEAGASNDFANALGLLGGFIMSNGKNIAMAGGEAGIFGNSEEFMANGGTTTGKGTTEVEGNEVAETPYGDLFEFMGPAHEQGGIDVDMPEGTTVFSDRIMVDGKTMADRKKARNRKLSKMEKLMEKNPTDPALKKSYERTVANMGNEEESDLAVQQMVDMFFGKEGESAFGDGIFSNLFKKRDPKFKDFDIMESDNASNDLGMSDVSIPGITDFSGGDSIETSNSGAASTFLDNLFGNSEVTAGDAVGILGDLVSAFGPLRNTLKNRATDTPNINAFKDFGKDALDTNEQAQEQAASLKTNTERKIDLSRDALIKRGRNSVRGVNAARALDLGAEMQANRARLDAQDAFARTMLGLLSERAGLENQQDRVVMAGEQQRDLADRQDKDNFYTQRGRDISTMGTGIQQIGKDLNAVEQRKIVKALIDQLSKYGITLDKDYQLSVKEEKNG